MRARLLLIITLLTAALTAAGADSTTGPAAYADTAQLHGNWVQQLIQTGFHINDPRIRYPKFANFCRKVYNWGDKTFNSYDSDYVVGTGKNWKVIVDATGSMQSYGYLVDGLINDSDTKTFERVSMRSNIGYDLGVRLNFMAISIGYTWNMNKLIGHNDAPRSGFNFSFTCARFSAEILSQTTQGNTFIDRFGRYMNGHRVHIPLDNTRRTTQVFNAFYFLNHRRYSQAAAYCYSKYQKRSAGSWIVGARYARQKVNIDFSGLPADVLVWKPESLPYNNTYNFHDICIQGGYAYNAVMPHNWLFNITALPGIGYRRSLTTSKSSVSEMVATNLDGRMSLVYNHRALFLNLTVKATASFLFNKGYSFFMSSQQASLIVGARF